MLSICKMQVRYSVKNIKYSIENIKYRVQIKYKSHRILTLVHFLMRWIQHFHGNRIKSQNKAIIMKDSSSAYCSIQPFIMKRKFQTD